MDSKTDANSKPWQFQKGDPRINRKGRPRTFKALQELTQQIAHEVVVKNGAPLEIDGHLVTVAENMVRSWATSRDPRLQQAFMEIAFGKAPTVTQLTGLEGGPVLLQVMERIVTSRNTDDGTASGAGELPG
jgi:hypothetical protein